MSLYTPFFKCLNQEIPYVVWKACHELSRSLDGEGDMDMLVDSGYRQQFRHLARAFGFVHAEFTSLRFPAVEHFYGYDEQTAKICHLHVYYEMVTGESHLKSYRLPLEKEIIGHRFLNALGVFEADYRDQALIYALRHYMKRASVIGFLFWAYERRDYLDEYAYIGQGLILTVGSALNPAGHEMRSEFAFDRLDMGVSLLGYRHAKERVARIAGLRRYDARQAAWMSLKNLLVRIFNKVFRVRKRLDKGLVFAVSGVDGSGKSSMVEELHGWFGRYFDVEVKHLGKPSPSAVTLFMRPLLSLYRGIKARPRAKGDDSGDFSGVKKDNGFIWGVRYLALAYERYRLARRARDLAARGKIVVCDRYPSTSAGKMDSPRIGPGGSILVAMMRACELRLYERIPKADALVFLDVSREEAIRRNRARVKKDKESDEEIVLRHMDNQGLEFSAQKFFLVDANRDYDSVLRNLKSIAWQCLSGEA